MENVLIEKTEVNDNNPVLTDREFKQFRELIYELTAINMGEAKQKLIYRRLVGRLNALGISSFSEYIHRLRSGDADEIEQFTNSITTNLTSFFRERHHFDYLSEHIIPEILAKKRCDKRLRVWSAGCSTGEEPYSIAITLMEAMEDINRWDAKVLCTDIDTEVLRRASTGKYPLERLEKLGNDVKKRWFHKTQDNGQPIVHVHPDLKEIIRFKPLNLIHDWPMKGPFDVIFCRNVLIYFDKKTQLELVERFKSLLDTDGYMILGHSESLPEFSRSFKLIGKTIYKKRN